MGLAELTQSSGWKKFMAKLYGWGASVVIIGALFKIMHYPGANIMLPIGLGIEAIIFFFSAFEPLHEELDWTLVYPELAGMTDPDELDSMKELSRNTGALERFEDLMGGLGGIDPTVVKNLSTSFDKLNVTAAGLSDVSQATAVTNKYVENVGAAADSVGALSSTFQQTASGLQQTAAAITSSSSAVNAVGETSRGYASQLEGMNKNIAALNAVYELQLRSTNEQMQKSQAVYGGMEKMLADLQSSVEETHRYREQMFNLNRNLANLNTIYGNMLSAMNVRG
jgi:gliding motility-associated protein GldL